MQFRTSTIMQLQLGNALIIRNRSIVYVGHKSWVSIYNLHALLMTIYIP